MSKGDIVAILDHQSALETTGAYGKSRARGRDGRGEKGLAATGAA